MTEDIWCEYFDQWYGRFETIYSKQYRTYEFAVVVLANHGGNNLLVVHRCAD
jgi:hypothetical protein